VHHTTSHPSALRSQAAIGPAVLGGLFLSLIILWGGSWASTAHGANTVRPTPTLGLSLAGDIEDGLGSFTSADLFFRLPLPWHGTPAKWHLNTYLWVSAGWLKVDQHQTKLTSAGPLMMITSPRDRWYIEAGTRAALFTNQALGRRHLGYPLEFISHGEVGIRLGSRLRIGSRFQHISNGGLGYWNPGINLISLQLVLNP